MTDEQFEQLPNNVIDAYLDLNNYYSVLTMHTLLDHDELNYYQSINILLDCNSLDNYANDLLNTLLNTTL